MKLKALLLALFTAGFAVSIAVAASPATLEQGKPTVSTATDGTTTSVAKGKGHVKKAAACKPAKKIVVTGEFVAADGGGFAMKVVGAVTCLGLKEAKDLVDGAPGTVKEGVNQEEADSIKAQLEEAGATVELK